MVQGGENAQAFHLCCGTIRIASFGRGSLRRAGPHSGPTACRNGCSPDFCACRDDSAYIRASSRDHSPDDGGRGDCGSYSSRQSDDRSYHRSYDRSDFCGRCSQIRRDHHDGDLARAGQPQF